VIFAREEKKLLTLSEGSREKLNDLLAHFVAAGADGRSDGRPQISWT
jgi:hypothetical protein